jgi:diadenosine tetraphosphate (Ap4A) HIT family hydrolase
MIIQNPVERRTEIHLHYHILPASAGIRGLFSKFEGTPYREDAPEEEMDKMADEIRGTLVGKN